MPKLEKALKGVNTQLKKATRNTQRLNRAGDGARRRQNVEADLERAMRESFDRGFNGQGSRGSL